MRFALVNGVRSEAKPRLTAFCPVCGSEVIPKCGDFVIHHWAHRKKTECDMWWENESEWHRSWKDVFPDEWQEVVHIDSDGKIHRSDVTNSFGWILEFQHSFLSESEIKERNTFYKKIVWILDGQKIKDGKDRFYKMLKGANYLSRNPGTCLVKKNIPSIVNKWKNCTEKVLIDIGHISLLFLVCNSNHGLLILEIPLKYLISASLDNTSDGLDEFCQQIDHHVGEINKLEKIPSRGFLARIPRFNFSEEGRIY